MGDCPRSESHARGPMRNTGLNEPGYNECVFSGAWDGRGRLWVARLRATLCASAQPSVPGMCVN